MKFSVAICFIIFSSVAFGKDLKIITQEFMPLAGAGGGGAVIGAHTEVAKLMCDELKVKCTFEIVPLDRGIDMMKNGQADVMMALGKTAEREQFMSYPHMVSQVGYTFFVKKGEASKYTKLEDFKGKTVGVQISGATGKDLLEQNKKVGGAIKIAEEVMADTAPRKLDGGRYGADAAVYCARAVCMLQAEKEKLAIEPVSFDAKLQTHGFGVSKKAVDKAEFDKINAALAKVMKSDAAKKVITANNLKPFQE